MTTFGAFSIGPVPVSPPLVLAPLHEITDQPFRQMLGSLGGLGLTVSEMITAEALVRGAQKARAMMARAGQMPFSMQLVGHHPAHLAECAALCQAAGADMVDFNMGCPASNVTKSGSGSALLRDRPLAERCLRAMIQAVKVPVTVKMRVGWDLTQKMRGEYLDFLKMFEGVGVQAVAIHPRTRAQQYTGCADWTAIARAVEAGFSFPIIGNGDVTSADEAHRMVRETGCQGVMIGRAALTNPFIFKQILEPDLIVTPAMRLGAIVSFLTLLLALPDERETLHKIKKIGGAFSKGLPNGAKFRQSLNDSLDPRELLAQLQTLQGA